VIALIKTISEDQAQGLVNDQYNANKSKTGYVANYVKAFSLRPEVYDAWEKLIGTIRPTMRLRLYELATFSSAMALHCNYCMLAHGTMLRKNFFSLDQMVAIVTDFRTAGLPPEEVAIMSFAQKVTMESHEINENDIEELHGYGFSDQEILDVILACAARNFFAKVLSATGAKPDDVYLELEQELRQLLIARL